MKRLRLVIESIPDIHGNNLLSQPAQLPHTSRTCLFLSFELRFLVEGLISRGILCETEVDSLHKALQYYEEARRPLILEALFKRNRTGNIGKDVNGRWPLMFAAPHSDLSPEVNRRMGPVRPIPPHCILVRKCLVTPTRCLLQPPQQETSNSMLRAYSLYHDRFLRVQFVDEDDGLPITAETLTIDREMAGNKGIFARLRRALRSGLRLAGRNYVFLCFGESQVKYVLQSFLRRKAPHVFAMVVESEDVG